MKAFFVLPLAVLIGGAATPPAEITTGRSVAIDPPQRYWLSDDLNRLFLQAPRRAGAMGVDASKR